MQMVLLLLLPEIGNSFFGQIAYLTFDHSPSLVAVDHLDGLEGHVFFNFEPVHALVLARQLPSVLRNDRRLTPDLIVRSAFHLDTHDAQLGDLLFAPLSLDRFVDDYPRAVLTVDSGTGQEHQKDG